MAKKSHPGHLEDFVDHGEAVADKRAGAPSDNTKSLTATTTASKIEILNSRISELEDWGTIPEKKAKREREYYKGRLSRNPVGRRPGPRYDISDHLERITEKMKSGNIKRYTAARLVVKEGRADGTITVPTSDKNIADRLAKAHKKMSG